MRVICFHPVSQHVGRAALWLLLFLVTMQVSAPAAAAECEASVSLVDFGRLDLERGGQVSGEVVVICDQPAQFSVALSSGIGSYRLRKMRGSDGGRAQIQSLRRSLLAAGSGVTGCLREPRPSAARATAGVR